MFATSSRLGDSIIRSQNAPLDGWFSSLLSRLGRRNADAPNELRQHAHLFLSLVGMTRTRGAATGVACIDGADNMNFTGVGTNRREVKEFASPWSSRYLMNMHSDGTRTRYDLNLYPGPALLSPALNAAVLYRDFNRGNDEVTVLACRIYKEGP